MVEVGMTEIGDQIRAARKAKGFSQAELAKMAGTNQQTVDKIERGTIKHSRFFTRILQSLGVTAGAAHNLDGNMALGEAGASGPFLTGKKDLPLYGAAQSGGMGLITVSDTPVDWEHRPSPLATVKDAYGIIVPDNMMEPEFSAGDVILVNPHIPPSRDVSCVFFDGAAPGGSTATIRRLIEVGDKGWVTRTWNPKKGQPKDETLLRAQWKRCHRIVGKFSRR